MRITKLLYVFSFIFILSLCLCTSGLAKTKSSIQKGLATWYGTHFHGQKTTSGEVYNKNSMTAAHLSLPFGTKVKVTNRLTKKSVVVRINDRGPWGNKHRIIDLSEAAARKIDLYEEGAAEVSVEILPAKVAATNAPATKKIKSKTKVEEEPKVIAQIENTASPANTFQVKTVLPYYVVQVGAFTQAVNARLRAELVKKIDHRQPIALKEEELNGYWVHRVIAGHFISRAQAEEYKSRLSKEGITSWVTPMPGAS